MKKENLSLYIHIPFCVKKCDYCDFLSYCANDDEKAYYVRVLQKEIRSMAPLANLHKVRTIFFGGGTPSTLETNHFREIMSTIRECYDIAEDAEVTIECNPGTLTEDKLKCYRDVGVNRLSIGLQSTHDDELKLLGRIHTYDEFKSNYHLARRMGFDNINIDIMSGLPKQTSHSFKETLDEVVALEPDHISVYSLIIEEGTPFYDRYTTPEGQRLLPSEDADRAMYHFTKSYLEKCGYERYEISNYAQFGKESKHNCVYWELGEYLGFGLGASSYFGGKRFTNPSDKESYWDYARTAYSVYKDHEEQPKKETMEEFMFLGLRMMKGVSVKAFGKKFDKDFAELYGGVTDRLIETGYIDFDGDNLKLTDKGIDVSNRVLANFLLP